MKGSHSEVTQILALLKVKHLNWLAKNFPLMAIKFTHHVFRFGKDMFFYYLSLFLSLYPKLRNFGLSVKSV